MLKEVDRLLSSGYLNLAREFLDNTRDFVIRAQLTDVEREKLSAQLAVGYANLACHAQGQERLKKGCPNRAAKCQWCGSPEPKGTSCPQCGGPRG